MCFCIKLFDLNTESNIKSTHCGFNARINELEVGVKFSTGAGIGNPLMLYWIFSDFLHVVYKCCVIQFLLDVFYEFWCRLTTMI